MLLRIVSILLIGMNASTSQTNMWTDTYYFRPKMLPSFLSHKLALKILVIGKTINYIQICIQLTKNIKKYEKITILPNNEYKPKNYKNPMNDMNDEPLNDFPSWLKYQLNSNSNNSIDNSLYELRYNNDIQLIDLITKIGKLTDNKLLDIIENR